MSDEGGVTLSDVVLDITLQEVTPVAGKGAFGKQRAHKGNTVRIWKAGKQCQPQ